MFTNTRERFRPFSDPQEFEKIVERPSVSDMWQHCLEEFAERIAIRFVGNDYSFRTLEQDAAGFRTLLGGEGEPRRIGILSANSYDFVKAFLAVVTSGNTAVILPPHLNAQAVAGCVLKFGIRTLVYQKELEENTAQVRDILPDSALLDIAQTCETQTPMTPCGEDVPCVMMFTGGTTGKSKCALLSNGAVMQGTVNGCYGVNPLFGQRYLLVLPFFHVFGLIRNLMTSLYTGSTLLICDNNKNMFRDVKEFRPTVMVMVPALAEMSLTLSRQFGRNMLGDDLRYIICGAAAVSPYLIEEYDKMGVKLLQGYGLTESANLVSGNPESVRYPDSIGIPYPNQELKIVDGELWLRGKNMMTRYVGSDDEIGFDSDGWFHTGDLVRIDDNGLLYITGRIKEIIVLQNGENISPAELEAHFNTLPIIQDSQVFEDVDERGKHILALEIVPRKTVLSKLQPENPEAFVLEALKQRNQELPAHMRVNRMKVRSEDFARTPSMKIVRYKNAYEKN